MFDEYDLDPWQSMEENVKGWGPFGPESVRNGGWGQSARLIDLTRLTAPILPVNLPAFLHFYWSEDGGINSMGQVVRTRVCRDYADIDRTLMDAKGINYLLYAQELESVNGTPFYHVRFGNIAPGEAVDRTLVTPQPVSYWLSQYRTKLQRPQTKDERYPHKCPKCKRPAYVGFNDVDCSGGCR